MHPKFADAVDSLHGSFEQLVAQLPICEARFTAPPPARGVYLFSEGARHLYVGRSNNIRSRYGGHCNAGSPRQKAAFAFKLAREMTGKLKAAYKAGDESQAGLMTDPTFVAAFMAAKERIRKMDFRCVEEADPVKQCLLEVYCAVVLETRYNDFDNH